MCGVIAKIKRHPDENNTAEEILSMFEGQKSRGTQGFGYVSFDDILTMYCRRQTRTEIEESIKTCSSRNFLFHHRIPTSTPNYADCAHPIKVSHKELKFDYYLIHNGMISNDYSLHEDHLALGYEYITTVIKRDITKSDSYEAVEFNDSESLAIDFARFIEAKQTKMKSRGSIAIIVLQVNKKTNVATRIFWGRNSSPLTVDIDENSVTIRSEGGTENVPPNILFSLDLKTWKIDQSSVDIGEPAFISNYGGYNYGRDKDYDEDGVLKSWFKHKNLPDGRKDLEPNEDEQAILDQWSKEETDKIDIKIQEQLDTIQCLEDDIVWFTDKKDHVSAMEVKEKLAKEKVALDDLYSEREIMQMNNVTIIDITPEE